MTRLRPLSEAECYARLYGGRESAVAVIRDGTSEPQRPSGGLLGEQLRELFEEGLDGGGPDEFPDVEAA